MNRAGRWVAVIAILVGVGSFLLVGFISLVTFGYIGYKTATEPAGKHAELGIYQKGKLPAGWKRFRVPFLYKCWVVPTEEGALATVRPNEWDHLTWRTDYWGNNNDFDGRPVDKVRNVQYLDFRGDGPNVGKPYEIRCQPDYD